MAKLTRRTMSSQSRMVPTANRRLQQPTTLEAEPTVDVPLYRRNDYSRPDYFLVMKRGSDIVQGPPVGELRPLFPTKKMFNAAMTACLEKRREHFAEDPECVYVVAAFYKEGRDVVRIVTTPETEAGFLAKSSKPEELIEIARIQHR